MTPQPGLAVVDHDTLSVRRTLQLAATPSRVWAAVTEPEQVSRWFGAMVLDGTGPGASGTVSWPDSGAHPIRVEAVDAPRSITYRWCGDDALPEQPTTLDDAHSTVFTLSLEPADGGTLLTVVETGFETTTDPAGNLESHRGGWNSELDELAALLDAATPAPPEGEGDR